MNEPQEQLNDLVHRLAKRLPWIVAIFGVSTTLLMMLLIWLGVLP